MKRAAFAFLSVFLLTGFTFPEMGVKNSDTIGQVDGPYVLYRGDSVFVHYIIQKDGGKQLQKDSFSTKDNITLHILTDEAGKTFPVKLREKLEIEEAEYNDVSKMFIVSDIEGNFRAFRKLLQVHQVIDSAFQWTFGNGHLVLTGDFVDRGSQQTEVMWLIYSLEEQAKKAGGHVHYILGNHEIMNLNGDLRYLHKKYLESASMLNLSYSVLIGEHSELGRWLRTKNVVERIGHILFCHGGISQSVNRMDFDISKINKTVRPFYADSLMQYDTPETDTLYSDLGPFWYRGYYTGKVRATPQQIDSTLRAYKVTQIATGHTVIADTISILFGGKVMNTDVHHAGGHTEAMYIENGNYFRATSLGEKFQVYSR